MRHRGRRAEFEAVAANVGKTRVFLVGNGPSLKEMNLDLLYGEDYFLCNLAERIEWTKGKIHPYYIATDPNVPTGYEGGKPGLQASTYFLEQALLPLVAGNFQAGAEIVSFSCANGGTEGRGLSSQPWVSVPAGQTVLLSATQIAAYLGYKEIYIIGCDLNYSTAIPYAYQVDRQKEQQRATNDDKMIVKTNRAFARLREACERRGILLANATEGGNLKSLLRVSFNELFKR